MTPPGLVVIDGGDRVCVALLLELRAPISGLPAGTVIRSPALADGLALSTQQERDQADIWQWKNGSRARRLGLKVPDLMARPLELPPDMNLGGSSPLTSGEWSAPHR